MPRKLRPLRRELGIDRRPVMDVACGPGTYLEHFGPGSFGLDRDPAALGVARERGCDALERDLDQPGWSSELQPFELVWLCDALVHLRDPRAFLEELRAVAPPGTPVAVAEWVLPASGRLWRTLAMATPGARAFWSHPEHLHRFTEPGLWKLLGQAGFEPRGRILHTLPAPLRSSVGGLFSPWLPPRTLLAVAAGGSDRRG